MDGEGDNDNPRATKKRRKEKQWIDLTVGKNKAKGEKILALLSAAAASIEDVLHCMNTCLSENSNFRRLTWTRKDRFYVTSYHARSLIEAALENVTRLVIPFSFSLVHLLYPNFQNFVKEVEDVLKVEFVSDNLKSELEKVDKKKKKQSKRKKSLKFKGRAKELGQERIAINIAQREVFYSSIEFHSTCLCIGEPEVQRFEQLPPPQ